jgi:hypothetical protein
MKLRLGRPAKHTSNALQNEKRLPETVIIPSKSQMFTTKTFHLTLLFAGSFN